jgi:hypothetical protein
VKDICAQFVVTMKYGALVCAAWLLSVTCTAASPIFVGTFELQDDPSVLGYDGPSFVVTNNSVFAGLPATFMNVHLVFDFAALPTLDFLFNDVITPGDAPSVSNATNEFGQSLLPDLTTVLNAYLMLTLVDPVTGLPLAGTAALGPTDPVNCVACSLRMTDFTNGSTLAIQFDPALPTEPAPVPEPMSLLLVGGGLAACAVKKRWAAR